MNLDEQNLLESYNCPFLTKSPYNQSQQI